jgi:hypothetical protein
MLNIIIATVIVLAAVLFIACIAAPFVLGHESNQPESDDEV